MTQNLLLDVSRTAARKWSGRTPSGIDRVCEAYCRHYGHGARAIVQLRGRAVILDEADSREFFAALALDQSGFRRKMATVLGRRLSRSDGRHPVRGSLYLNVGHSDFDLDAHLRWSNRLGLRPVYLLHDLIPITHPHLTKARKVARHRGRVITALDNGAGIITNSQTTVDALHRFAQEHGRRLPPTLVAHLAPEATPPVASGDGAIESANGGASDPYFVTLGTIEARKNHELLLRIWSRLIEQLGKAAPKLVILGNWGVRSEGVKAMLKADQRLRERVEIRQGAPDGEVAPLLAGSRALLMPTHAEGFGLPLVEAMQMGVPVIANDLPILREIGQGIPTLIDVATEGQWLEHIADFCVDSGERARQIAAMATYRAPTWSGHFRAVDDWLAQLDAPQQQAT